MARSSLGTLGGAHTLCALDTASVKFSSCCGRSGIRERANAFSQIVGPCGRGGQFIQARLGSILRTAACPPVTPAQRCAPPSLPSLQNLPPAGFH